MSNGIQERIERRVPENDFAQLLFSYWDRQRRGTLSLQDIVSGLDEIMFLDGDVAGTTDWFFRLHAQGNDRLSKSQVLTLSESLLFSASKC